jgi:phospholipid/cholesterol/gamma-HCH transport system permease protein
MRVNQEVDALTTMGLDPVRFLGHAADHRAVLMAPLLTIMSDVIGLVGGAITMQTFRFRSARSSARSTARSR